MEINISRSNSWLLCRRWVLGGGIIGRAASWSRHRPCVILSLLLFSFVNFLFVYLLHTSASPWLHSHGGVIPRGGLHQWFGGAPGLSCHAQLRFLDPPSKNITALASAPGSGNTWVRYLLQQATGVMTGSEYYDTALKTSEFPGEGVRNGSVLVVKTHQSDSQTFRGYNNAILLLRHPRDAILAEFNRLHGGHLGHATDEDFKSKDWKVFFRKELSYWIRFHDEWLHFQKPMHIVWYEDLQRNLTAALSGMLRFLNVTVSATDLECAVHRPGWQLKRKPRRRQNGGDVFTPEMAERVARIESYFRVALDQHQKKNMTYGY